MPNDTENIWVQTPLPKKTALTTAHRLTSTPVLTPPPAQQTKRAGKATAETIQPIFTSSATRGLGGLPITPPLIPIADEFQPAVGVYIVPAPSGAGKSVLTSAIVAWANTAKNVDASYIYCFEPRAKPLGAGDGRRFASADQFTDDVDKTIATGKFLKLVVLDSVSLPMKSYAKNFPFQPTFTGGLQPSDRGFLDRLGFLATAKNACIIAVINTDSIPYAASLYGSVEGMITLGTSISQFQVQDRTSASGRNAVPVNIPLEYVRAAVKAWNLGEYRERGFGSSSRGFIGIGTK